MTVAISCNLSDGVILGVDSAVSLPGPGGILKVYENAEKLFQIGKKPIGLAIYGLGGMEQRSIGSYIREFEKKDPNTVVTQPCNIAFLAEELRKFFHGIYAKRIIPVLEQATGKSFKDIPKENIPILGLVVGGFSANEYLSEIWEIIIPWHSTKKSSIQLRKTGDFGTNWFATYDPIRRYIKGYDPLLIDELLTYMVKLRRGRKFKNDQQDEISKILNKHEYPISFEAMPMEEGIKHTKFLVEMVINHYKYSYGAPIVGGTPKIGKVTYKGEQFQLLEI